jgi:hypothetical protein
MTDNMPVWHDTVLLHPRKFMRQDFPLGRQINPTISVVTTTSPIPTDIGLAHTNEWPKLDTCRSLEGFNIAHHPT